MSIYFEQQTAALCGRHAINNLLQGPYVTEVDLARIASELDEKERILMLAAGAEQPYASALVVVAAPSTQVRVCLRVFEHF